MAGHGIGDTPVLRTLLGQIPEDEEITSCHRRGRVETKIYCVRFFGQGMSARVSDRQITEMHVRGDIPNRLTARGPFTHLVG